MVAEETKIQENMLDRDVGLAWVFLSENRLRSYHGWEPLEIVYLRI
jgi:hypothetical protein